MIFFVAFNILYLCYILVFYYDIPWGYSFLVLPIGFSVCLLSEWMHFLRLGKFYSMILLENWSLSVTVD